MKALPNGGVFILKGLPFSMNLTEKIILLAIGMSLIIFISVAIYNKNDMLKQLKESYEAALQSGDKEKALAAGRAYYQSLRGGELTAADERLILKDVSGMPEGNDSSPL